MVNSLVTARTPVATGVTVGDAAGTMVSVGVGVALDVDVMTQSDGSEFGCCEGYEHTSTSDACEEDMSDRSTLHDPFVSSGYALPEVKGSSGVMPDEQVVESEPGVKGVDPAHLSVLVSTHE